MQRTNTDGHGQIIESEEVRESPMQKVNMKELFFALLRNALWHSDEPLPKKLTAQRTAKLLWGVEQQTVGGLVIEALVRNKIEVPEDQYYEAIGMIYQIQQSSQQVTDSLKAFAGLMDEGGVRYVVVKGQAAASYYPNPILREAGDIDYYCDEANMARSLRLLREKWNVEPMKAEADYQYEYHGVDFEGHFMLSRRYSKRWDSYWEQLLREDPGAEVTVDGTRVKTLSPTLHTLYIFLHLYHHLLELGIGIRQFCDWAVMLHACRTDIDQEALRRHLKALGMERAYRACGWVLVECLGLPQEEFTYKLKEGDRRYVERILRVVFYRGNMGKYNKRSGFSGWKHNVEATGIKVSHFMKFMPLSPSFSCRWIASELTRKFFLKLRQHS